MAFSDKAAMSSGALNSRTILALEGYEALQARLNLVAPKIQEKLFKKAVKPSLSAMMSAAKANVRGISSKAGTGLVRSSIARKISIRTSGRAGSRYKTIGKLAVFYGKSAKERGKEDYATLAHLIEYGFKLTHYFGKRIKSRRIMARPFMRPAFEAHKSQAEQSFVDAVVEGCEELGI